MPEAALDPIGAQIELEMVRTLWIPLLNMIFIYICKDSIGRETQNAPLAVDFIKRATETELMHSASYKRLKDGWDSLRERVRQAEKKSAALEEQIKQLR